MADFQPSEYELTYLLVNDERKKSFLADRSGSVFIFDITEVVKVRNYRLRVNPNLLSILQAV